MKQILFCLLLSVPVLCFTQVKQSFKIEILNEEITMQKKRQDVVEIRLHVFSDTSFLKKSIEFSQYVESNSINCAYLYLNYSLDEIPIHGLEYYIEDSDNNIVCSRFSLPGEPVHPQKDELMIVPVIKKNLKIKKTKVNKDSYSDYLESNLIKIEKDTIVNVYPLINWGHYGHYGIKKGEYYLYFLYKNYSNDDGIYDGPIISNKVKLIIK